MSQEIHIFATEPDEGTEWTHNDWFYSLNKIVDNSEVGLLFAQYQFERIGKLYKSRSAAARAANKIGKVVHWYPI